MGVFNFLNGEELKVAKHDALLKSSILKASASNLLVIDKAGVIHFHTPAFLTMTQSYPNDFSVSATESSLSGKHIDDIAKPIRGESLSYALTHATGDGKQLIVLSEHGFCVTANKVMVDEDNTHLFVTEWQDNTENKRNKGMVDAIMRSQAVISFTTDGEILSANDNFLSAMGYTESEVVGKHHRLFVDSQYASSEEYRQFWQKLKSGEVHSGEFRRINKQGNDVWIQATYNPVFGDDGAVDYIIKFASDITEQKQKNADYEGQITAINKSQAVIEFDLDGQILTANDNFLSAMGYSLDEIKGQHHSMFVDPSYKLSNEYAAFWQSLKAGEHSDGEYKRIGKGGREIWIRATYNPIIDSSGKPFKVVKFATDITQDKLKNAYFEGQINAISKSQAVIEFDVDGNIITANDNFLNTMGYRLDEVKGKHHQLFVDEETRQSETYQRFWSELKGGKFFAGEFKRVSKEGKNVWIQASYNPIEDMNGKPFRVVKYATNITEDKLKNAYFEGQLTAISKSQAVIEFDLEGVILNANSNFLSAMGYTLDEVKGKHHSIFVDPAFKNSPEYAAFWDQLRQGIYASGEYKRFSKAGEAVYIQASYNPILDQNGKPFRVVKYATDVTGRTLAVERIKSVMASLSDGDLLKTIDEPLDGDFQVLGESINHFIGELRDTIVKIHTAVETIDTASNEIATGNADLSSRTEQQASSLEETASAMEELTGTVKLNAENADQAKGLASQASDVASEGGKVIEQVVHTMGEINDSAQRISDIIGVIDGIAFQTNILALNAAVEAARAGEQGRGFAVVASEVRTLAQRSAEAAKDIKALISASVDKIGDGNVLVNKSGETMANIVTAIKRVNDIMSEIAAASSEQATGIQEVSNAVVQMDEMTQQNAALVEEAAAAADSMRQQSGELAQRVSVFKVGGSPSAARPTAPQSLNGSRPLPKEREVPKQRMKALNPAAPDESDWEAF
ncbi:methyl-accepting chemotaxis protein [Alteromonas mediterranea]|uniref:methyl-accepting chemotaxis protein n=1 Tax=Alteromonas mediterranea TaxID=314275 RepID=UPI0009BD55CC|nr:methyl-accepting chemotaxis protein [Alteromonas mediterranea]QGX60418.1 PAS domain S-box protein [Alteromonas mediterranea]